MRATVSRVAGSCGLGVIYGFEFPHQHVPELTKTSLKSWGGGIGYNIAAFVDTDSCKQMYDHINSEYTIVFQSPVKMNHNSGRRFFFIIFKV